MNKPIILSLLLLCSCYRSHENLEPQLNYTLQDRYLNSLPTATTPLTTEERSEEWGKEFVIGMAFSHELDLYRAVTALKRADILIPPDLKERRREIQYEILWNYYLGQRYDDVISTFEKGLLRNVDAQFKPFEDLLVILYDSYNKTGASFQAESTLNLLQQYYPDAYENLLISRAFHDADLATLEHFSEEEPEKPYLNQFLTTYNEKKKSPTAAQLLNTFIPGAGYFYLDHKQTGITALLVNGLFIAASYHFFHRGQVAAGIITLSFEAGWYFGGIIGAGQEAKLYNERLYEKTATPIMNQQGLFPVFMLNYAF